MDLVETTIAGAIIRMRYADAPDRAQATEWIEFQVPLAGLKAPIGKGDPLGNPEFRNVGEVRLAALRYMRDAVGEEIQRLQGLANRIL